MIYDFLSDPVWQSVGAIVGAIGVFFGAWFGAELGIKGTMKLNKMSADDEASLKFSLYKDEIGFNSITFHKMDIFIKEINQPSPYCFEAIEVACKHIKRNAWSEFLKCESKMEIASSIWETCLACETVIDNAMRDIEMDIADWKRELDVRTKTVDKYAEIKHSIQENINKVNRKISDLKIADESVNY